MAQGADGFLGAIEAERMAQGQIAREVARAAMALREVLLRVQEDAKLFRVLAVDLHEVKEAPPGVVVAQREAGERLVQASREIATNAREVTQIVAELRAALARLEPHAPNGQVAGR